MAPSVATPFTAPFVVNMQLTSPLTSRTASTTAVYDTNLSDYAVTYEDWVWQTTCENTQFGQDSTVEGTAAPKLAVATPTCAVNSDGVLQFTVPEAATSADWTAWKMTFKISIKMPANKIGSGATLDTWFSDPNSMVVYAATASEANFLTVSKPSDTVTTVASLVSFGVDPNLAAE